MLNFCTRFPECLEFSSVCNAKVTLGYEFHKYNLFMIILFSLCSSTFRAIFKRLLIRSGVFANVLKRSSYESAFSGMFMYHKTRFCRARSHTNFVSQPSFSNFLFLAFIFALHVQQCSEQWTSRSQLGSTVYTSQKPTWLSHNSKNTHPLYLQTVYLIIKQIRICPFRIPQQNR